LLPEQLQLIRDFGFTRIKPENRLFLITIRLIFYLGNNYSGSRHIKWKVARKDNEDKVNNGDSGYLSEKGRSRINIKKLSLVLSGMDGR
jgi:hypothetical protein